MLSIAVIAPAPDLLGVREREAVLATRDDPLELHRYREGLGDPVRHAGRRYSERAADIASPARDRARREDRADVPDPDGDVAHVRDLDDHRRLRSCGSRA